MIHNAKSSTGLKRNNPPTDHAIAEYWLPKLQKMAAIAPKYKDLVSLKCNKVAELEDGDKIFPYFKCFACLEAADVEKAHIHPHWLNGPSIISNFHLLCRYCHRASEELYEEEYWTWLSKRSALEVYFEAALRHAEEYQSPQARRDEVTKAIEKLSTMSFNLAMPQEEMKVYFEQLQVLDRPLLWTPEYDEALWQEHAERKKLAAARALAGKKTYFDVHVPYHSDPVRQKALLLTCVMMRDKELQEALTKCKNQKDVRKIFKRCADEYDIPYDYAASTKDIEVTWRDIQHHQAAKDAMRTST